MICMHCIAPVLALHLVVLVWSAACVCVTIRYLPCHLLCLFVPVPPSIHPSADSLPSALINPSVPPPTLCATAALLARRPSPSQATLAAIRGLSDTDKCRLYVCGLRVLSGVHWEWFESAFRRAIRVRDQFRLWRPRLLVRLHVPLMLNDVSCFRQAAIHTIRHLLSGVASSSLFHVQAAFIPSACPSITTLFYNAKRMASQPLSQVVCPCHLPHFAQWPRIDGHVCVRLSDPFMRDVLSVPLHWNRNSTCLPTFSAVKRQFRSVVLRLFRRISQPEPPAHVIDQCAESVLRPAYSQLAGSGRFLPMHDVLRHSTLLRSLACAPVDKSKGDMAWMCPLQ